MAHSLSAKKRIRQNRKRQARNRWRKNSVKAAVKAFETALGQGDKQEAGKLLRQAFKTLDRVAAKGTIHKNAAARKKSRLALRLQKASSPAS